MDYYSTIERNLEAMGRDLEGLTYEGVPVFHFLKITTYLHFKNRYLHQQWGRIHKCKSLAWQVVRQLWCPDRIGPAQSFASAGADYILVIDHYQPNFILLMLRMAVEFGEDRVLILTKDRRIEAELQGAFAGPCYTPTLERTMRVKPAHLRLLAVVYRKTPLFRNEGKFFTLACFADALTTMKMFDFYLTHLDPAQVQAVLTLSDVHPFETAVTKAAGEKGIPNFTLQHGVPEVMFTPVHSDRIFVWGEKSRQDLLRLGVPPEKIVISGCPLLDEAAAKCKASAPSLRASFRARHPRGNSSGRLVTYIATNLGNREERALLAAFAATWNLGILPVVRLKPTHDQKQVQEFRDWISELGGASEVQVSMTDDLYELLTVSDVVVGSQSSVVVESLAFGCIPVLLDILPEYDLRLINPHYGECLIARDADALKRMISRMTEDPAYFKQLQEAYAAIAGRYFGGQPGVPATRFIRDYIVNFASPQA